VVTPITPLPENDDFHDPSRIRRASHAAAALFFESKDQATRLIASPRIETMSSIWLFSTIRGGDNAKGIAAHAQ